MSERERQHAPWRCRHDSEALSTCSICYYDLPEHMRAGAVGEHATVRGLAQAQTYLDARFASVRRFGGGHRKRIR